MTLLQVLIILGVFGLSLIVVIYYYLEKTKSDRLKKIKKEKTISPENEAYNRVKSAKRINKMLKRKGSKDKKTDKKLNEAERALKSGKTSEAKKLAEEAKEKIADKSETFSSGGEDSPRKTYTVDELDEVEFRESEDAKKKREELKKQQERLNSLPDNYLESKFEMKRVKEMLDEEEDSQEAEKYYAEAERCFEEEDYTEALKYTIRCRKVIRGEDPELISFQEIDKKEPSEELKEKFPEIQQELTEKDEKEVPGTERREETEVYTSRKGPSEPSVGKKLCPDCGFEGTEEDKFCPRCGTELVMEDRCPECGNEVDEDDQFCRKCGAELEETPPTCPECGTEAEPEDAFCGKCGAEL